MASETIFFEWLDIERFRGFADCQHFDLEASVIVLWGPNGTGKTSFFDAIQWLLVGSIDRLELWRVKRNAEHIVNRYSSAANDSAVVTAGIRVGEQQVEIRRSGRYNASQLEWREESRTLLEDEAEAALAKCLTPVGRMSVKRSLLSSGLLQQDVIREVLEDKPSQRYEQLAAILGLDSIAAFPQAARKRADRLAEEGKAARDRFSALEARVRDLEARQLTLRNRYFQSPDLDKARAAFVQRLKSHEKVLRLRTSVPVDPGEAAELRKVAGVTADLLSQLHAEAESLQGLADQLATPEATLEILRRASVEANERREAAKASFDLAEQAYRSERALSDQRSRLAREALPLLGDACPVCRQAIDKTEVHEHLHNMLDEGSSTLKNLDEERERAGNALRKAEEEADSAERALRAAESKAKEIERARVRQLRWRERVEDVLRRCSDWLLFPEGEEIFAGNPDALRAVQLAVEDLADATTDLFATLDWQGGAGPLDAVKGEMTELQERLKEARENAVAASTAEEEGKALQRAAVRAVTSITEERFDVLRPVIQDIYSRLDPHPTFTRLQFAVEVYREKGIASPEVLDAHAEVNADPLLVFSSSQANVVALSSFLALGWAAGEDSMPFLLLDDPLQSLDDVNALGFADLCRHMRSRRQLVVSTHDERLASLLVRKLAPRQEGDRSRVLHFVAWNRRGPIVEAAEVEPQLNQRNLLFQT